MKGLSPEAGRPGPALCAVEQAEQDLLGARYVGIERGAAAGGIPTRERVEHRPVLKVGRAPVVRGAQQVEIGADLQPEGNSIVPSRTGEPAAS